MRGVSRPRSPPSPTGCGRSVTSAAVATKLAGAVAVVGLLDTEHGLRRALADRQARG